MEEHSQQATKKGLSAYGLSRICRAEDETIRWAGKWHEKTARQASGLPSGLKINTGTGQITGTVAVGDFASGPFSVSVTANDGISTASQTFTWNVNTGLVLSTPADQSNNEGNAVSLQVQVTGGGANLAYGALGLPTGGQKTWGKKRAKNVSGPDVLDRE